jgi:hypothetical protein
MREPEMVCPGASAISPRGGRPVAGRSPDGACRGRGAPIPDLPALAPERGASTLSGYTPLSSQGRLWRKPDRRHRPWIRTEKLPSAAMAQLSFGGTPSSLCAESATMSGSPDRWTGVPRARVRARALLDEGRPLLQPRSAAPQPLRSGIWTSLGMEVPPSVGIKNEAIESGHPGKTHAGLMGILSHIVVRNNNRTIDSPVARLSAVDFFLGTSIS